MQSSVEVMFGGQAGDGGLTTGDLIAAVFRRSGLEVSTHKDFPSRIRGGHTNYVIRACSVPDYGLADAVDALVAFDIEAVEAHISELRPGGCVIFDSSSAALPDDLRRPDLVWYEIPLARIAKDELGREIVRNTMALGVLGALFGIDPQLVRAEVRRAYERKGAAVVDLNVRAIEAGERALAAPAFAAHERYALARAPERERLLMLGNDAIAFGALVAGCRFVAGYPITPATDILEWMAREMPRFGGVVVQAEDELAAITMVLGAAWAGTRAMTATSGPGQALMTEAIGLAGVLEIPVVVVECARAGPSTGMPTKTEQSNLNQLIYGGHGEIPRVVLAPGTVHESFELTVAAFNLAEQYQLPVFVLTEQALCQSKATLSPFDVDPTIDRGKLIAEGAVEFGIYQRFALADDGVSPRVVPGVPGGMHLAAGSEHDAFGVITEAADNRARMMEKRMRKLDAMRPLLPRAIVHGVADADIAIVGYGANRGPIVEAVDRLGRAGIPVRFLQLRTLWPFPADEIRAFIRGTSHIFLVENNFTGQLEALVRGVVGPLEGLQGIRKYDGRPFRPIEIVEPIARVAQADERVEVPSV